MDKFCGIQVIISTHFYADGPAQFLNRYLIKNKIDHLYIEHPFLYANRDFSIYKIYFKGKEIAERKGMKISKNNLIYYIRDFWGTLFFGLRYKCEIGIGFDNLNSLSLLFLKLLGRIRIVVYVTVDYTPVRFENKFLNWIYHTIDQFCCYHADILWDSSSVMKKTRIEKGMEVAKMKPVIVVDDGCSFEEEKIKKFSEIEKYRLVFMGHLKENPGIELLIDVVEDLSSWNRKISLLIIGGGEKLAYFKQYAKKKGLSDIVFTGFVENHDEILEMLRKCYLSFALYKDDEKIVSKYSAVGKPKVYMACGLPVIITDVPELAKRIDRFGAGRIVKYNKEDVIKKVREIINDKKLYLSMRERAIKFARNNTWDKIFDKAFTETNKLLN